MFSKKNSKEINVELVFKLNNSSPLKEIIDTEEDCLILKSIFWEEVFLCWIKIAVEEHCNFFPSLILDKKYFSLSLEILNDEEMKKINQKWLNKSRSTDVLSFPIIYKEDGINLMPFIELGDIFISFEKAFKQSKDFNHSLKREILWLASHGFLHLLGWEHKDKKELESMLDFQKYLISKVN